jgi:hypothetical protein
MMATASGKQWYIWCLLKVRLWLYLPTARLLPASLLQRRYFSPNISSSPNTMLLIFASSLLGLLSLGRASPLLVGDVNALQPRQSERVGIFNFDQAYRTCQGCEQEVVGRAVSDGCRHSQYANSYRSKLLLNLTRVRERWASVMLEDTY